MNETFNERYTCTSKYFYSMGILLMYFQVFLFYGNFTRVLPSIFILWDFFYSCTSKYLYSMGILLMNFQVFLFYGNFTRVLPSIFILWDFAHVLPSIFISYRLYMSLKCL